MNNIHEKDWAEEGWSGHTGMDSLSGPSIAGDKDDEALKEKSEAVTDPDASTKKE
jgi:hypothetical protein